jgi:hypothetical protein
MCKYGPSRVGMAVVLKDHRSELGRCPDLCCLPRQSIGPRLELCLDPTFKLPQAFVRQSEGLVTDV